MNNNQGRDASCQRKGMGASKAVFQYMMQLIDCRSVLEETHLIKWRERQLEVSCSP